MGAFDTPGKFFVKLLWLAVYAVHQQICLHTWLFAEVRCCVLYCTVFSLKRRMLSEGAFPVLQCMLAERKPSHGVQMASYVGCTDVDKTLTNWFKMIVRCHLGDSKACLLEACADDEGDDTEGSSGDAGDDEGGHVDEETADKVLLAFKGKESESHLVRMSCCDVL